MVRGKYLSTLRHALIIIETVCISNIVPGWVISVYITCLIVIEEWNFVLGVGFCDPVYLEQFFHRKYLIKMLVNKICVNYIIIEGMMDLGKLEL